MEKELEISLIIDPIIKRLDGHGANLRDLADKMDSKFLLIMNKIESIKDMEHADHKDISIRLIKIESERGIIGKIAGFILGIFGGVGGSWIQKHF